MKIEIPFLAGLLFVGTDLLARAAVQGVEQALFSTAIEYGLNAIKTSRRVLTCSNSFGG
jgi:hypothetical protein